MNKNYQKSLGFFFIIASIICLIIIYMAPVPGILLPEAYELAIDGYVISRNILLFIIFVLIAQLGYTLIKE